MSTIMKQDDEREHSTMEERLGTVGARIENRIAKAGEAMLSKFVILSATSLALFCSTCAAYSQSSIPVSPVVTGKTGGAMYQYPDLVFPGSGWYPYNSYTLTAPTGSGTAGYVGVNIPQLGQGLLPNLGPLAGVAFYYGVLPVGNANTTDPSFRLVAQTTDGTYHLTSPTSAVSDYYGTYNGINDFTYGNQNIPLYDGNNGVTPSEFVPQITNSAPVINKLAVLFYGTANCKAINLLLWEIAGTSNAAGEAAVHVGGAAIPFSYSTQVDPYFNFSLNRGNTATHL
jgi:hypothetical protein